MSHDLSQILSALEETRPMEVAIVGMAGRFPGARNLDAFWQNLCNGVESISFFTDEEVEAAGIAPELIKDPHYVKAGGVLDGVEDFDASFFNIYPREAAILDPQHRVFLEIAWEALENAGYNPETYPGWIGVFAGSGMNTYMMFNLLPNLEIMESVNGYQLNLGNDKDFMPTRTSYKLNLRGPSINVQTACSTSLVAVHLACQSLLSYHCDMVLAGGVNIRLPQKGGYLYQEGGITSPDGHCRAFDARAAGTVGGNGAGVVVLKRLADAVRDGDTIYAIIKGSAINNDGSVKVGYTAPSIEGQVEVISTAQAIANVDPATISYIETHGTGTALGDPIEVAALTQVFQAGTDEKQYCAIGSVKTNVGHLDAAAGVVSLIKTTLALKNGLIPPSLHFTRPNPKIDFENSPFFVNTQLRPWDGFGRDHLAGLPRRAGISSFGIGGTNVHMILEEAAVLDEYFEQAEQEAGGQATPVSIGKSVSERPALLLLSARSNSALEAATDRLVKALQQRPEMPIAEVAYTFQVGRKAFGSRRVLVCSSAGDAVQALSSRDPMRILSGALRDNGGKQRPQIVFMFSGQGAQYPDMAYGLYQTEAVFRDEVDHCAEILMETLGQDLRDVIFSGHANGAAFTIDGASKDSGSDEAAQALMQTAFTQPALFVIEYATARLLIHWGIEPHAMIGHSIGEYVAACLAGVFSLEDGLKLVAARGRLMQSLPGGAMLSVPLSEAEILPYLGPGLSLSAVNGPSLCVISGDFERIDALSYRLANDGIEFRRLRTSHAFHSEMMDPILDAFRQQFDSLELGAPEIPIMSNVTGTWLTAEQAVDPDYWVRHLRQTVRFSDGVGEILRDPAWVLLEIGPGQTLTTLAKNVLTAKAAAEARPLGDRYLFSTLRPPRSSQSDQEFLLTTLGRLWLIGVEINWQNYHQGMERRRLPLPAYPFEYKRYWVDPDVPLSRLLISGSRPERPANAQQKSRRPARVELRKRNNPAEWLYTPSWKRLEILPRLATNLPTAPDGPGQDQPGHWLVFTNQLSNPDHQAASGLDMLPGAFFQQAATQYPQRFVVRVEPGESFQKTDSGYQVNPSSLGDMEQLFQSLEQTHALPQTIVYLWGLGKLGSAVFTGLEGLLNLVKVVSKQSQLPTIQLGVVTQNAHDVTGEEVLDPHQASFTALCKVISQETANLVCRNIDLSESLDPAWASQAAAWLILEMTQQPVERFVAYRGRQRWAPLYDPIAEHQSAQQSSMLRQNGVYLITGGLGRIGLTFAEHLAVRVQARLVLVDRFDLPPRQEWESLVEAQTAQTSASGSVLPRIKRLLEIEALGYPVLVLKADVSQPFEMQQVIDQVVKTYGGLDGLIHAAGLVGEAAIKPLVETDLEALLDQSNPKLNGLEALQTALLQSGQQPDFVFIQSSLSAVLGGLGLGAYAAANAALGLAAARFNRRAGWPDDLKTIWMNVDWDGWQFPEAGESRLANLGSRTTLAELTMTPDEGIQVFERALSLASYGHRHLVVSTAELEPRIAQWVTQITASQGNLDQKFEAGGKPEDQNQSAAAQSSGMFPRPNLQTTYVAPRNSLEDQIVEAWQKILGITPVGVYDDFFELGGHSLLATQLVTRLRDTYKVELPLRRLFESPTVAGLVALIEAARQPGEALPVDGQSIAEAGMPKGDSETPDLADQILPIPRAGDLPLSFGQQRLWFIDQLEPGSPLYNNFAALRLIGDLDFSALEFCVQKIVQRHESLRTTFHDVHGQPVQTIHEQMDTPVRVRDLLGIPAAKLDEEITRLAINEASQPFDLSQGPLLRLVVMQTGSQEHVIFLTMHHIVSDGWSVAVLIREVAALYTAYKAAQAGHEVNLDQVLPELPIQYVDYAAWQRNWLQGERLESQLNYWKEQLKHNPNLELFGDAPRPAVQSWHGANQWFELPVSLSNALAAFNQREGVTMFMTLMAALQILLMRYTGQEDFSVGTPVANRTRIEAESLIGFVLNTLVIRADCSGDPTFIDLLKRVRECALQAYTHQDLPFEMLVEALQPERDMSRAPFFQVIFDLQVSPLQSLKLPGLTINAIPIDGGTAKFDLALSMEEGIQGAEHQLKGYLNYNSDLFEPGTVQRLLGHFQTLLEGIIAHPDWRLSQLPLLTEAERRLLLKTGNWPTLDGRQEMLGALLPELIHQQALKQPAATALVLADRAAPQLSYAELDRQAEVLARRLVKYGVAPETLVGVCVTRSLEMIVGLLAILKAGGAFLPLDPAYPPERLAYMLEDSRSPVVLTQASLLEANPELARLFQTSPVQLIQLDAPTTILSGEIDVPTTSVSGVAGPENLAYVIYTSGSTGKPKGVMITHAVAANHCRDMARHFGIQAGDSVLQFASLNFDAGLEQVFTALISGARLVIRDEDVWTPAEFHQKIKHFSLNVINLPPAYWQPWIQYVADLEEQQSIPVSYPSLRLVIVGGDLILVDSLKYWLQSSLRRVRLLNAYGPTETTITATTFEVKDVVEDQIDTGSRYARLPIGLPHPNRTAYILDSHGKLLPVGVPGELHLGGSYLARGYLNQPGLTEEKFIPDPFEPGGRLYKTGDLARRLPDGNIDFIGRIDGQVKVRGFRIELGEIEAAILTHPAIREASVVLHTDMASGDKSLVAYVVSQGQAAGAGFISPAELFEFLKEKLPGYMLPAAFVELDQLPLAPSGKVDRKALAARPLSEQSVQHKKRDILAPRSPLEQEILDLWIEVLQRSVALPVSEISIEDNFFELGGHSLIATQIVSRLREKYQVDLPLRQLFENPTVAGIAGLIAQSLSKEVQDEGEEDLEALLAELEGLTEEEARLLLSDDEDSQ